MALSICELGRSIHHPKRLITKICPVPYEPGAQCNLWLSFLGKVIRDVDVINFLQRAAGMSASGHAERDHGAILLYGEGANGKGTFTRAIMEALGDYADAATTGLLLAATTDKGDYESADLRGKRMIVANEVKENGTINEARLKRLTGGDRQKGRGLYQGFGTGWKPTHTIWLESNHLPRIKGQDEGIWRRIDLVDFPVIHRSEGDVRPGRQHLPVIDPLLGEKLRRELPGILAWVVHGAVWWTRNGLNPPAAVQAATGRYREDQDLLGGWISESSVLLVAKMGGEVAREDVAREIIGKAIEAGEDKPSDKAIAAALKRAGYGTRRSTGGKRLVTFPGDASPAPTQGIANA